MFINVQQSNKSYILGNFFNTILGRAKIGSIGSKLYILCSSNKLNAAIPKNVWKTSTQFPGLSLIPPSES